MPKDDTKEMIKRKRTPNETDFAVYQTTKPASESTHGVTCEVNLRALSAYSRHRDARPVKFATRFHDWKGTRMTIPTTNYTTYDLAYYYADLRRLPRLSREKRQGLVTGLSESPPSPALSQDDTKVKQRLIEGYLPLVKHLAITLCSPALYQRLLPELIGAVNLAVVEAVMRCDLASMLSLDAYIAAYVRGAIKQTIIEDDVLPIPSRVRERARAGGTLDQLYAQQRSRRREEDRYRLPQSEKEHEPCRSVGSAGTRIACQRSAGRGNLCLLLAGSSTRLSPSDRLARLLPVCDRSNRWSGRG